MNRQQIYDKVARHLLTQMKRSVNDKGNCVYRGPNGLMCGVGCLISDSNYRKTFDDMSTFNDTGIARLLDAGKLRGSFAKLAREHVGLLMRIQNLHDEYVPDEWHDELSRLAAKEALDVSVLQEFNTKQTASAVS